MQPARAAWSKGPQSDLAARFSRITSSTLVTSRQSLHTWWRWRTDRSGASFRTVKRILAVILCTILTTACGTGYYVGRAMEAYHQGNYAEASREFRVISEAQLNAKGEVRYLVFRGLTHYLS